LKQAKHILLRVTQQVVRWRVMSWCKVLYYDALRFDVFKFASAMAYISLLSLVPSLAAVFALISIFAPFWGDGSEAMDQIKSFVLQNLARGSGEQALGYIESFIANLNVKRIGISGFLGITVSLLLLLRNIELALNKIFGVFRERNIFSRFVNFWTFITLGTFLVGVSLGIFSGFDVGNLNPFGQEGTNLTMMQALFPKIAGLIFFTMLYKITPNMQVGIKHAFVGAVFATILFSIASSFYGVFAMRFTNYRAVYGALAAIPLFLLWLYLIWLVILFGAMIASRSIQGFQLPKEDTVEVADADRHLQSVMLGRLIEFHALLIMLLVAKKFTEAQGGGVGLNELRSKLNSPDQVLLSGLKLLEDHQFIWSKSHGVNAHEVEFMMARSPDKVTIVSLREIFRQPLLDHINGLDLSWLNESAQTFVSRIWPEFIETEKSPNASVADDEMSLAQMVSLI
jgi:membrane protein